MTELTQVLFEDFVDVNVQEYNTFTIVEFTPTGSDNAACRVFYQNDEELIVGTFEFFVEGELIDWWCIEGDTTNKVKENVFDCLLDFFF